MPGDREELGGRATLCRDDSREMLGRWLEEASGRDTLGRGERWGDRLGRWGVTAGRCGITLGRSGLTLGRWGVTLGR